MYLTSVILRLDHPHPCQFLVENAALLNTDSETSWLQTTQIVHAWT